MKHLRLPRRWTALCLIPFVSSCGTTVAVQAPAQMPIPPSSLLRDCPEPEGDPATLRELILLLLSYSNTLADCNSDKQALRRYYAELEQGHE